MAKDDKDLDGVLSNIRACLISTKGAVPLRSLSSDYYTIVGEPIPFKNFNHPTLESFLRSLPSLHITGSGPNLLIEAEASRSSSHISNLVAKQKTSKKKPYIPPPSRGRGAYRGRGSRFSYAPVRHTAPRFSTQDSRRYPPPNNLPRRYSPPDSVPRRYSPQDNVPRRYSPQDNAPLQYSEEAASQKHSVAQEAMAGRRYTTPFSSSSQNSGPSIQPQSSSSYNDDGSKYTYSSFKYPKTPSPPLPATSQRDSKREPLVVRINRNDERQVSVGAGDGIYSNLPTKDQKKKTKQELPPRLRRLKSHDIEFCPSPPPISDLIEGMAAAYVSQPNGTSSYLSMSPIPGELENENSQISSEELAYYNQMSFEDIVEDQVEVFSQTTTSAIVHDLPDVEDLNQPTSSAIVHELPDRPLLSYGSLENLDEQTSLSLSTLLPDDKNIERNISILQLYAKVMEWTLPEFSVIRVKKSHDYLASVKIFKNQGVEKHTSFPHTGPNQELLKGYAAKRALEELHKESKKKESQKSVSCDKNVMSERIRSIVEGAQYGIWSNVVESTYAEKYMENLPENWTQLIRSCPNLGVDHLNSSRCIIFAREPPEPIVQDYASAPHPPPLNLPTEDVWDVYVTSATSTCKVWIQLIGDDYSEKFFDLTTNMELYYKTNSYNETPLSIEEGQHYVAETAEGWLRVLVREIIEEEKTVKAWLIDFGQSDKFPFNKLYRLVDEFCMLPKQALQCCLDGLENFGEDSIACETVMKSSCLIGQTLIAKVTSRDTDPVKVTLFDTSGPDDENINEKILSSFTYKEAVPSLPNEGHTGRVYVLYISPEGEMVLRTEDCRYILIEDTIESLGEEEIIKHKVKSFRQIVVNKLYLAKYSKDNGWYRAKITEVRMAANKISVVFVDFGNRQSVSISEIADIQNLPLILSQLPPQAVTVSLNNLPVGTFSKSDIVKLHSLVMDEKKIVLIKTVDLKSEPPVVEMFCKNENGLGEIVSVNMTIISDRSSERLSPIDTCLNGNNKKRIKYPEICEDIEPVLVTLASNPGNFLFTMKKCLAQVNSLMKKLEHYYNALEEVLLPVSEDEVVQGAIFAALNSHDKAWYRVVVIDVQDPHTNIAVRLCDYGDLICIGMSELRELDSQFLDTPMMAAIGRLSGVVPKHGDWEIEDCIRFRELVEQNKDVTAKNLKVESSTSAQFLVATELYISNQSVADILVQEKRAIKVGH